MVKSLIKIILISFSILVVSPLIFLTYISLLFKSEIIFDTCGNLLALFPGYLGSYLRVAYYYFFLSAMPFYCHIGFGSFFSKRNISIGNNVSIGAYCVIGSSSIGDNTLVGSRVSIPSGRHQHMSLIAGESNDPGCKTEIVTIGSSCWIGEGAIILNSIGSHCLIGSGSVVTKIIPDHCMAAGNPARVKKDYDKDISIRPRNVK